MAVMRMNGRTMDAMQDIVMIKIRRKAGFLFFLATKRDGVESP